MQVKVWNDNVHVFKQDYKDSKIEIPAKGFIWMEPDAAHDFKCSFAPIKSDADGNPTPETYKMIRIEAPKTAPKESAASIKCHKCGYPAASAKDLGEHTKFNHADDETVTIEELDALTEKKAKPKKDQHV